MKLRDGVVCQQAKVDAASTTSGLTSKASSRSKAEADLFVTQAEALLAQLHEHARIWQYDNGKKGAREDASRETRKAAARCATPKHTHTNCKEEQVKLWKERMEDNKGYVFLGWETGRANLGTCQMVTDNWRDSRQDERQEKTK